MLLHYAPYILVAVAALIAASGVMMFARSRKLHDHPHNYASRVVDLTADELDEAARQAFGEAAKRARDHTTPTCPLCGRYNAERPFIRHAIDCHRDDCRDIEHQDPFAHEH